MICSKDDIPFNVFNYYTLNWMYLYHCDANISCDKHNCSTLYLQWFAVSATYFIVAQHTHFCFQWFPESTLAQLAQLLYNNGMFFKPLWC